jgi:hypothetical protein
MLHDEVIEFAENIKDQVRNHEFDKYFEDKKESWFQEYAEKIRQKKIKDKTEEGGEEEEEAMAEK